jgi:hypothetical protein
VGTKKYVPLKTSAELEAESAASATEFALRVREYGRANPDPTKPQLMDYFGCGAAEIDEAINLLRDWRSGAKTPPKEYTA